MDKKPQRYAIMAREVGSDSEVKLCEVQSNPQDWVEKAKKTKVSGRKSGKILRYDSVRAVALSIAIAITSMLAPGHSSASPRTYDAQMCRTLSQVRADYPHSYPKYRTSHGRRCWFPADRLARITVKRVEAARPSARPAKVSDRLDLPVESNRSPPLTFDQRWRLR